MDLLHALDIISTFAFALVGARVAADRGLDYGGIAFIATIASIAGGTLRNVFLGLTPVWINDPWILASVLTAVIITLSLRRVTHVGKILLALDTFALAVATLSGTQLAFELEIPWFSSIILGVITAVTGGLLRDVLCQVFVLLNELSAPSNIAILVGGLVVIATRFISIRFDLHLPKFKK